MLSGALEHCVFSSRNEPRMDASRNSSGPQGAESRHFHCSHGLPHFQDNLLPVARLVLSERHQLCVCIFARQMNFGSHAFQRTCKGESRMRCHDRRVTGDLSRAPPMTGHHPSGCHLLPPSSTLSPLWQPAPTSWPHHPRALLTTITLLAFEAQGEDHLQRRAADGHRRNKRKVFVERPMAVEPPSEGPLRQSPDSHVLC